MTACPLVCGVIAVRRVIRWHVQGGEGGHGRSRQVTAGQAAVGCWQSKPGVEAAASASVMRVEFDRLVGSALFPNPAR